MAPTDTWQRLDWLQAVADQSPGTDGTLPFKPCTGPGGARVKLLEGTTVTIRDASDKIVASAALDPGSLVYGSDVACSFPFKAEGVPASDFYTVSVGSHNPVTVSTKDLESSGWTVTIQSGGG